MIANFTIQGYFNTDTLDEAIDILTLILEENNVDVHMINIDGGSESLICRKKK